jgi:2-polyprenyl-6-methoxyphenol hydroxylase-like FAD-dependent oxidoreductase
MVGAYILAGELKESKGNYEAAFQQYENIFKPLIETKQKLAQSFAGSLIPKNNFAIWIRNTFANVMFSSLISKWFVRKYMTDKITLKEY